MNLPTRLAALLCFLSCYAAAQFQVKGTIKDASSGAGIPFASIVLMKQSDSTMVAGQMSTEQGTFDLSTPESGLFFLTITSAGYQKTLSEAFALNTSTSPVQLNLVAAEHVNKLDEVVVRGEKPFFEQKIDRTVINVQSTISRAGGTALDILQRSPGVTVDKMNSAISLLGKQGVRIMINGKISRIPMEAVVQMLGSMNAENIERIELITTPPSRYEAEGDAGMINIVMKQSADLGTNGSISAFTGYGRDYKYGGTLNMNNRSKKLNIYGDLSTRQDHTQQFLNSRWSAPFNNALREIVSLNDRGAFNGATSGTIGAEWQITKKTSIGGSFNVFDRIWDMDATADINQYTDGNLSSTISMNTLEENNWTQYVGNINLGHKFNDDWNLIWNLDHIDYSSENPTTYTQEYFDSNGSPTNTDLLRSRKFTDISIWTSSFDITGNVTEKVSIEFGTKGSFTQLDNDIIVDNFEDPDWIVDPNLTVYAQMYENILAGYVSSAIKATPKLNIMAGIRYEHTVTNIDTQEEPNAVDRNYGKWFPTLFLSQKINDNNSVVLSYSRRISRPSFFQLAPFVIFNDPNNFYSGNISLLPSFTDAVKAEYRYKTVLFSLLYSYDQNAISLFQPQVNEDGNQVSTAQNLDYRKTYSATVTFPVQFTRWWELQVNATASTSSLRATYLDAPIELSMGSYRINGIQKFSISKSITAELTAYWTSKQYFGVLELKGFGGLDIGLEKRFNHSSLRASYTDIFETNKMFLESYIAEEDLHSKTNVDFETTYFMITYTFNFGNGILKGANKKMGSKDEQDRLRN
ncbi:MAG TPA: TonB-dependent receptor [Cyclobacteriaceae bacterium]|nr:TonB-dependent receptor [Cyclobacteriaceae bacterium]